MAKIVAHITAHRQYHKRWEDSSNDQRIVIPYTEVYLCGSGKKFIAEMSPPEKGEKFERTIESEVTKHALSAYESKIPMCKKCDHIYLFLKDIIKHDTTRG